MRSKERPGQRDERRRIYRAIGLRSSVCIYALDTVLSKDGMMVPTLNNLCRLIIQYRGNQANTQMQMQMQMQT